jgi:hypothetical protein
MMWCVRTASVLLLTNADLLLTHEQIMKKFEGIFLSLGYFVKYAFDGLSSERDALEVEAFFKVRFCSLR